MRTQTLVLWIAVATGFCAHRAARAQDVGLPAPRLLTIFPMGGRAGTTVEVAITGENIEGPLELHFSDPKITAKPKVAGGANAFTVAIAADAPRGVGEAWVSTRLGVSSTRVFTVGGLPETARLKPNQSPATALAIQPNSILNATATARAVDFYSFQAAKGERFVIECAARGVDSKLNPVLAVADAQGRDFLVDRRGGPLDFKAPAAGVYSIKVHDLTYHGGTDHFYRLALLKEPGSGPAPRQPATATVGSFSWVPDPSSQRPKIQEAEPNDAQAQKITPPCEIDGRFFPAADVDAFEFTGKKGETWWVEVASERLGLPTDPFVVVQRVTRSGSEENLVDVAEFNDVPSPIKPSSNGYSYDGPVYDAGSADVLGELKIQEDGLYRLQLRDLFGGTRSEPRHVYKLIIRKAAPDFALAAWALHMNLRNGDRNALSKPIALRGGATMMFEVAVVRKDGFAGPIELAATGLPEGVAATGVAIPAGKSVGTLLFTARQDAPRSFGLAAMFGRAVIDGKTVERPIRVASMVWPVKDASQEIPMTRLVAVAPVSVTRSELAPVTITAAEHKVWVVEAGGKLAIPLKLNWTSEFAGDSIKLTPMGADFKGMKPIEIPIKAAGSKVELDPAALKLPPGEYVLALHGSAVARYKAVSEPAKPVRPEPEKAEKAGAEAAKRAKAATAPAATRDVVDIVAAEPIRVRVKTKDPK